jgi:hypothetical protein
MKQEQTMPKAYLSEDSTKSNIVSMREFAI